jgi:hypothetical protein
VNSRKISGKFRGKFPKCQKFPGEISPENFPEIPGVFSVKCKVTAQKSIFLVLQKYAKSGKIPGEISGKFHKFRKFAKIFPENSRKIPGKFPENQGVF